MTSRLTKDDREAFRELTERGWAQSEEERSARFAENTPEARERYCRWATDAAKFFKGKKPACFVGSHWKL